ncbi:hypothetical protein FOZ60_004039 [Perkinsus olseni]|uniref:Uncharacterized protein n=1 Tax=Perkinsus olseni TaxID=32597 RepID=A0A7J6NWA0_PEROL|nr:hypothetical protein FOZ60_004030 [Perkinsus olseni]KAF4687350.1 hypothetical protein FOZ60_004039 [Perkinsus olseni]
MATIPRLLLPLLLAIVGTLGLQYKADFGGYKVTFDYEPSRYTLPTTIRCDTGRYSHRATLDIPYYFPHYYKVKNHEVMAGVRKHLEEHCGLILHEAIFSEVYVFDDFMVTNLDDTTYAIAKRSRNVDLDVVRD